MNKICKPCNVCNGKGEILVWPEHVTEAGPLGGEICPRCNGDGVVDITEPMVIISVGQNDDNSSMIVEFANYAFEDWMSAINLMRDKNRVAILECKTEDELK